MNSRLKHLCMYGLLVASLALLAYDSRLHFSERYILLKRQNNSAQKNWNIFYGQRFVYYDSSFRYQHDVNEIKKLIEPGNVVLSDLASSYYVAASLPVYVRNVQRHHGRWQSSRWQKMLDQRVACNLHQENSFLQFKAFVDTDTVVSKAASQPTFKYVLVNKDVNNKNVRSDCLTNRKAIVMENIERLSMLVYEGEFLNLYKIGDSELSTSAP